MGILDVLAKATKTEQDRQVGTQASALRRIGLIDSQVNPSSHAEPSDQLELRPSNLRVTGDPGHRREMIGRLQGNNGQIGILG
jgi:hypothetical protein